MLDRDDGNGHTHTPAANAGGDGDRVARRAALALVIIVAAISSWGLGDEQPFTGDEAIVLSVSETLVREGRLGASIFTGLGHAEEHYFASLPLLHVLHWPLMELSGVGIAAARAISMAFVFGVVAMLAVFATRIAGGLSALVLVTLLLLWRSDLLQIGWGLPITALARSGRYDGVQMALLALSLVLTAHWVRKPSHSLGTLLGLVAGASTLTHFLGVIAPATVVLAWTVAGRERPRLAHLALPTLVFLLVLLPYLIFVLQNLSDFAIQMSAIHGTRAEAAAGGLRSLLQNILNEPNRYAHVLRARTPGPWLLFAALPVAAWWLIRNWKSGERLLARTVIAHGIAAVVLLALFEPTKAPLYAHPLVPAFCLVLAFAVVAWLRNARRPTRAIAAAVLILIAAEGTAAMVREQTAMSLHRSYEDISRELDSAMTSMGAASGATRWWWSQRHRPYTPFITILYRARTQRDAALEASFRNSWNNAEVQYLIRTPEFDAEVTRAGPDVADFLSRVMQGCGRRVLSVSDATYGPVDIFELTGPCVESVR